MKPIEIDPPSTMQAVFERSRIYNPSAYIGDRLSPQPFKFPEHSWLRDRMDFVRGKEGEEG